MEAAISTSFILDTINELSNERQQLWLESGKKPYRESRHERIIEINSTLKALWVLRRIEMAGAVVLIDSPNLNRKIFADFRERAGLDERTAMRLGENGSYHKRVGLTFRDNRRAHEKLAEKKRCKKQTKRRVA